MLTSIDSKTARHYFKNNNWKESYLSNNEPLPERLNNYLCTSKLITNDDQNKPGKIVKRKFKSNKE